MAHAQLAPSNMLETEYSIYVYRYPDDVEEGGIDWERRHVTCCSKTALGEAQALYESKDYRKVEVKKKYFDQKYRRIVDATIKVLQEPRKFDTRFVVVGLLGGSFLLGFAAFILPFISGF